MVKDALWYFVCAGRVIETTSRNHSWSSWCRSLADDILIYGAGDTDERASADHDQNLVSLLQRAKENNMKFNLKKLKLRQKSVAYMGHLLTSQILLKWKLSEKFPSWLMLMMCNDLLGL